MSIQKAFEETSTELLQIYKRRKELDERKAAELKPLRDRMAEVIASYGPAYFDVEEPEMELRETIKALYVLAKMQQEEAYAEAIKAQKAGDMEALKDATVRANTASITPSSNVFFRTTEQILVDDITKVPVEYLIVDRSKLPKDKEVPGIRRIDEPSVVVKL